jgi:hypothetical protein
MKNNSSLVNAYLNEFNEYYLPQEFNREYFTKRFFQQIEYIKKEKNKSKNCMFPGCKEKSIVHSHSIQKEGPLRQISINGKVIYPRPNNSSEDMDFKILGISKASIFPGFCKSHENFFSIYENKEYDTNIFIILQNFRALCREISNRNIINDAFTKQKNIYYNDEIIAQNRILSYFKKFNSIKLLEYNDSIIKGFDKLITDNSNFLILLNEFYNEYEKLFKEENADLFNFHINTDMIIPISLSGLSTIDLKHSERTIKFITLCSVMSKKDGTDIFFTTLNKWKDLLLFYLNDKTHHNLGILSLIESWMIFGSDNWYLNPEVYSKLPEKIKEHMKSDIVNLAKTPSDEVQYSIFRDIRNDLIIGTKNWIDSLNDMEQKEVYTDFLQKEIGKQYYL